MPGPLRKLGVALVTVGPGLFLIGYNIGTGSVVTMASSGATFGMSLFWAVVLSCVFTYVLMVAYGQVTVVTGRTALANLRRAFPASGSGICWLTPLRKSGLFRASERLLICRSRFESFAAHQPLLAFGELRNAGGRGIYNRLISRAAGHPSTDVAIMTPRRTASATTSAASVPAIVVLTSSRSSLRVDTANS
jgi:hypothetical protein